jgi:predicted N-acetyltransferase YhbS
MEVYDPRYCEQLSAGHLLRWGTTPADREGYATLTSQVFKRSADAPANQYTYQHSLEVAQPHHPLADDNHLAVVVDEHDQVVAGAVLQRMPMDYAGVRLHVGRPEVVATAPSARNRGFVRQIFKLLHAKSEARGDHIQAITGIPYFYRQFGYEYAIDYDRYATVAFADVPAPDIDQQMSLRRATAQEFAPFVVRYDSDRLRRPLLATTPIEASYFQHLTQDTQSNYNWRIYFIEQQAAIIGYVIVGRGTREQQLVVHGCAFDAHINWQQAFPALMQALASIRTEITIRDPNITSITGVNFFLDAVHPIWQLLQHGIKHQFVPDYAWYVRVPNYVHLMTTLRPVLERRLYQSSLRGHSGTMTWSFYGSGLEMKWHEGQLVHVKAIPTPRNGEGSDATFPAHMVNMLIFGRKSFAEMKSWHHEINAKTAQIPVLNTLFPTQASWFHWLD